LSHLLKFNFGVVVDHVLNVKNALIGIITNAITNGTVVMVLRVMIFFIVIVLLLVLFAIVIDRSAHYISALEYIVELETEFFFSNFIGF